MVALFSVWLTYLPGWITYFSPMVAEAPAPILLQDAAEVYAIGRQLAILEDTTAQLSFDQILEMDSLFRPSQEAIPSFGASTSAAWSRFRLENRTSQAWYLEINAPYVDSIDVYGSMPDGTFTHLQLGSRYPFKQRPVLTNQFIAPLDIAPHEVRTYYVRIRSTSSLTLPLTIASMQRLYEYHHRRDVFNGVYFGLVLALMVYNLFVFITIRDVTYLYYVLYILGLSLTIGYLHGYTFEFLTPGWPWFAHLGLTSALASINVVLFTDSFLLLRRYAPKLRMLGGVALLSVLTDLFLSLSVGRQAGFRITIISYSLMLLYVFTTGFTVYFKGFKPARFYLLGFGVLVICALIVASMGVGILPPWPWIENLPQIASGLEVTVLSFALADKLNTYKQDKEQAQALALEQSTRFSHQLIQSQEQERKRIAAELHDSIGQSLILMKNKMMMLKSKMLSPEKSNRQIEEVTQLLGSTIGEVRSISYGLRPFQLDMLGLSQSIRSLAEEVAASSGITFNLMIDDVDDLLTKEQEINLYRIVQECLNNLVKHSQATQATLELRWRDHTINLRIEDNGIGIHHANGEQLPQSGFGMIGLQERLKILGGSLTIHTAKEQPSLAGLAVSAEELNEPGLIGSGTVLCIQIPTAYEKH